MGYKANIGKGNGGKKVGFLENIGLFLAALAPGCAACGIGLVSVFSIGAGFLAFLPHEGLELSILSIVLFSFTIVKITNEMYIRKIT